MLAGSSILKSCVLVCWYSSPGSGFGASMLAGDPVAHDPVLRYRLGPVRDRIGEVPAEHALERLDLPRGVQPPQEIVEGTVLEARDHVVHHVASCGRHRATVR